jgi:4-hydroxy-tetrahydrodipicolinate reductase
MVMTEPYRIAIWGPGDVGSICIREAARLPELEVVGAYVYSEHKDGVDVGTLAGTTPLGVDATRNLDDFLALDCDVVIYTALDLPNGSALDDFVTLLEAGKNVITSQPYNYLPVRDPGFAEALEAAAKRGGATFYAGGINPDFIGQRWALAMTGLSNDVRQIKIEEYFDCVHQANPSTLALIGLGGDPAEAMSETSPALFYQRQYWFQMIEHIAATVGVELSRIEASCHSEAAPEDLTSPVLSIEKGRTGLVSYESTGYVGDEPFVVMKVGWYLTSRMKPAGVAGNDEWILTIEGRPSVRCVLNLQPSFMTDATSIEGEPAAPGYLSFGICLLQAIPRVVAAEPGIKPTDLPPVHWKRDMRTGISNHPPVPAAM